MRDTHSTWTVCVKPGKTFHYTIIIRFFIKAVKKFPYNHYISCRPLDSSKYFAGLFCVNVHLASPCYLMAMKLSNFRTLFYARRIITSNIQVNALLHIKQEINEENLRLWKECKIEGFIYMYLPVCRCLFMSSVQMNATKMDIKC